MGDILDLNNMIAELYEKHNILVNYLIEKGIIEKPKETKEIKK